MTRSPADPTDRESLRRERATGAVARLVETVCARVPPQVVSLAIGLGLIWTAVTPAAAQSQVGDVYCGTGVETGINLVFGALAGLGLPATAFFTGKAGLDYMHAGGKHERRERAREEFITSAIGFGIITLALVSPELIDKVSTQMGFAFSECVKPF